jgi:hypothetical protein
MRDEFYADRRDLWKWTVALHLAGTDGTILYVAMLRPRAVRTVPPGVDSVVREFFLREWAALDRDPLCARIRELSPRIKPLLNYYQHRDKRCYFDNVRKALGDRGDNERYVVLLDPDTGLAGGNSTREHLCWEDMASVWDAMKTNDILLIYQHNARAKKETWMENLRLRMAAKLGRSPDEIDCCPRADVCFLSTTK